ncbi:MAG: protein kinase [Peptococcaceae bacterium]|nr:protein kinase [Peptococcaceae bacterium]
MSDLLGEGSYGKVYKISRQEFDQTYDSALKIISIPSDESVIRQMESEGLGAETIRESLMVLVKDIIKEINLLSAFRGNSHIVSYEDHMVIENPVPSEPLDQQSHKSGKERTTPEYLILIRMELLESLAGNATQIKMSPSEVVKLGVHICRALERCAMKNIIHRDIKPDNIFVSEYGDYKLGDFGIARQIERNMSGLSRKGTYSYMAPEVYKGEMYGTGVDIYSLGIVMYTLLNNNRSPFLPDYPKRIMPEDRDSALLRRMGGEPIPVLKGISPELNAILQKACAFDHHQRFTNSAQFRKELEAIEPELEIIAAGQLLGNELKNEPKTKKELKREPKSELKSVPKNELKSELKSVPKNELKSLLKREPKDELKSEPESEPSIKKEITSLAELQQGEENREERKRKFLALAGVSCLAVLLAIGLIIYIFSDRSQEDTLTFEASKRILEIRNQEIHDFYEPHSGLEEESYLVLGAGVDSLGSKSGSNEIGPDDYREDGSPNNSGSDDDTADGTKTDGTKTDGTKTDGTKTDGAKTDGTKTDGTKTDGTKTDGTKTDGTKTDVPRVITYNYTENGGTSTTKIKASVVSGAAVDLTPKATKKDWEFVGWNTNKAATKGLASYAMPGTDVTLYAIYKKTLKATFRDYSGGTLVARSDSVDIYNKAVSGEIKVPQENTYTGWSPRGWSTLTTPDAAAKVAKGGGAFSISADTTLYGLYERSLTVSYEGLAQYAGILPASEMKPQYANSYAIGSCTSQTFQLKDVSNPKGLGIYYWVASSDGKYYNPGDSIVVVSDTKMSLFISKAR